jgi:nickel-dependent lactate racemase
MKLSLPFGDEWVEAEFPDSAEVISPGYGLARLEPHENQEKAVEEGIENPIDIEPIREIVKPWYKVTIAFDDPTVPCFAPVWIMALKKVIEELKAGGVDLKDVKLICANALHRKFRKWELERILGDYVNLKVECHDAEDKEKIVKCM